MNQRLGITVVTIAGLLSISTPMQAFGVSDSSTMDVSVIRGNVQSRLSANVPWSQADSSIRADGSWVKTGPDSEAVVTLPNQMRVRMEQSTCFRVKSVGYGGVELELNTGKAFASIPTSTTDRLAIVGQGSKLMASNGDFLIDVSGAHPRLEVLDGDAQLTEAPKAKPQSGASRLTKSAATPLLALDGPDVRTRNQDADEFSKNKKKKKKKGAGFVETPANTTVAPPDVAPPDVTPPVPPPPTTTVPPATVATTGGGGSNTGFYVAGLAILGIGLGFALSGGSNNNNNNVNNSVTPPTIPVSP